MQTVESDLEFDACFHFEFSKQVITFEAQPIGFEYHFEGEKHRYTPDFAVLYCDTYETFYEIKPKHIAQSDDFIKMFLCQKEHARKIGKDLHVLTEDEIQIYPLLDNLKIIHRYACDASLNPLQRNILTLFKKYGELRIEQVVQLSTAHSSKSLPAMYDLVAKQLLKLDMHQPINWQSPIWCE